MKKGSNSNLKPTSFGKRRNGKAKKAYSKSEQKPKTYKGQGRWNDFLAGQKDFWAKAAKRLANDLLELLAQLPCLILL